jgi:hypothetical protein
MWPECWLFTTRTTIVGYFFFQHDCHRGEGGKAVTAACHPRIHRSQTETGRRCVQPLFAGQNEPRFLYLYAHVHATQCRPTQLACLPAHLPVCSHIQCQAMGESEPVLSVTPIVSSCYRDVSYPIVNRPMVAAIRVYGICLAYLICHYLAGRFWYLPSLAFSLLLYYHRYIKRLSLSY